MSSSGGYTREGSLSGQNFSSNPVARTQKKPKYSNVGLSSKKTDDGKFREGAPLIIM